MARSDRPNFWQVVQIPPYPFFLTVYQIFGKKKFRPHSFLPPPFRPSPLIKYLGLFPPLPPQSMNFGRKFATKQEIITSFFVILSFLILYSNNIAQPLLRLKKSVNNYYCFILLCFPAIFYHCRCLLFLQPFSNVCILIFTNRFFFLEAVRLTTKIWTELLASDSWLIFDANKEPTIISFSGGRSL